MHPVCVALGVMLRRKCERWAPCKRERQCTYPDCVSAIVDVRKGNFTDVGPGVEWRETSFDAVGLNMTTSSEGGRKISFRDGGTRMETETSSPYEDEIFCMSMGGWEREE